MLRCTNQGVVNVAITLLAASMVTAQLPDPEQAPVHMLKDEPLSAAGASVTSGFAEKLALHVAPQLIPAGDDVTAPAPFTMPPRLKLDGG